MQSEVNFFHVLSRTEGEMGSCGYENELHPFEIRRNRIFELDYTVAYVLCEDTCSIIASRSVRHPHDRFVKKTGRELAEARLMSDVPFDSYFDAVFPIADFLEGVGLMDAIRNIFRPAPAEAMELMLLKTAESLHNISGSAVNDFLRRHFDDVASRQQGRFKLGCNKEKGESCE